MTKKMMLLVIICLSLGAPISNANDTKKIIIDPQYKATTDKLNREEVKNANDYVANIVNSLKACLEKNKDYRVVLTNSAETYAEDSKRSKIANDSSGDVLISIAVFCSEDNKENIEIINSMIEFEKKLEGSSSGKAVFGQDDILNDLKQDSLKKFNEGVALSRMIQKRIGQEKIKIYKEIKFEPVEVLIGANMPATLIKLPYLEKTYVDHGGQRLNNKVFIDRLVASIYAGVNEFWHQRK